MDVVQVCRNRRKNQLSGSEHAFCVSFHGLTSVSNKA